MSATPPAFDGVVDGEVVEALELGTGAFAALAATDAALGFGGVKKDVMDAFAFGFFASEAARSTALRLRDMLSSVCVLAGRGRRND